LTGSPSGPAITGRGGGLRLAGFLQERVPLAVGVLLDALDDLRAVLALEEVLEAPLPLEVLLNRLLLLGLVGDLVLSTVSAGSHSQPSGQGVSTLMKLGPSVAKAFSALPTRSRQRPGML